MKTIHMALLASTLTTMTAASALAADTTISTLPASGEVTLSGTVESIQNEREFTLLDMNGKDTIGVDIATSQNLSLQRGDHVKVIGMVDKGIVSTDINASSVSVVKSAPMSNSTPETTPTALPDGVTSTTNLGVSSSGVLPGTASNSKAAASGHSDAEALPATDPKLQAGVGADVGTGVNETSVNHTANVGVSSSGAQAGTASNSKASATGAVVPSDKGSMNTAPAPTPVSEAQAKVSAASDATVYTINNLPDTGKVKLSGTVAKVSNDQKFTLQDATGSIAIDLPAGNPAGVKEGAQVTVVGFVDKGIFMDDINATDVIVTADAR